MNAGHLADAGPPGSLRSSSNTGTPLSLAWTPGPSPQRELQVFDLGRKVVGGANDGPVARACDHRDPAAGEVQALHAELADAQRLLRAIERSLLQSRSESAQISHDFRPDELAGWWPRVATARLRINASLLAVGSAHDQHAPWELCGQLTRSL